MRVSFGFFSTLPLASYMLFWLFWMLEAARHLLLVQIFPELQLCVAVKPDHVGVICGTLGLSCTKQNSFLPKLLSPIFPKSVVPPPSFFPSFPYLLAMEPHSIFPGPSSLIILMCILSPAKVKTLIALLGYGCGLS